jgi:phosphopantetheine--protein transferase-like protein
MRIYHGCDLTLISRFQNKGNRFICKILNASERATLPENLARFLGVRWALKEAVYKALYPTRIDFHQITVTTLNRKPIVSVQGYDCVASVSHEGDLIMASVILTETTK